MMPSPNTLTFAMPLFKMANDPDSTSNPVKAAEGKQPLTQHLPLLHQKPFAFFEAFYRKVLFLCFARIQ
jgi:hypothetical protein